MTNLEAVIEIGSTGIRLMAFEIAEDSSWQVIDKSECSVPLGYDVFTTGYLSRDTILQVLHILERFKEQLQG
ncbi:MAG: phosphatase, partial [Spirochaetaceae bacterium]|nr:phosphatase [Spirochaetaceae bacterium]